MRQSTKTITAGQKQILAYNGLYLNVNLKVNKTNVTLDENGILLAGTIIDKEGKSVNTSALGSTAFGIVYEDVDFNNSMGTEVIPVTIFGFIKTSALPAAPVAEAVTSLKMIQFMDYTPSTTTTTTV
ncbi:hypothetical protein [Clostridium luticellarii]|jgi:hypothetical protein|uniref:Uncharacterized protein n=1 Tax=Clostridium luticellarii TaxID=1691940 RepID=A0A2T0BLH8_9CLOT|nr:hypothetical protein [Clostridium luticellarii]PRR84750.1 hypothetical protein CLLU_22890 [Clostridium luticellarii]